ncbi:hypothetical protein MMC07_000689 [Pseudocyphellaria aurata]|nr:hypothetical protein [Pseudocyphellaria aurata]
MANQAFRPWDELLFRLENWIDTRVSRQDKDNLVDVKLACAELVEHIQVRIDNPGIAFSIEGINISIFNNVAPSINAAFVQILKTQDLLLHERIALKTKLLRLHDKAKNKVDSKTLV